MTRDGRHLNSRPAPLRSIFLNLIDQKYRSLRVKPTSRGCFYSQSMVSFDFMDSLSSDDTASPLIHNGVAISPCCGCARGHSGAPKYGSRAYRGRSVTLGYCQATLLLVCAVFAAAASGDTRIERICPSAGPHGARCSGLTIALSPAVVSGPFAATGGSAVEYERPFSSALTPSQIGAAYRLPTEPTSAFLQTIAVIDAFDDPTAERDLRVFDEQYGLPPCTSSDGCLTKLNETGTSAPLPPTEGFWAAETSLDVQVAHSVCGTCRILLLEANSSEFSDLGRAVTSAVSAGATVIANSYESEGEEASEAQALDHEYYEHPDVVLTASAGDCGYRGERCEPPGVSFPASSPNVISVGGTTLRQEPSGEWTSTTWPGSGGGCSSVFDAPTWQRQLSAWTATGCGHARLVADVAVVGDPETGVSIYDSTPLYRGGPRLGWRVDGGTSVGPPLIAAEYALAGGAHGVRTPARALYASLSSEALFDVTSGTTGTCSDALACEAAPGFDGPSGVGSPLGLGGFILPGVPVDETRPEVTGNARVGDVLYAVPGSWSGGQDVQRYQWARCNKLGSYCLAIDRAEAMSYRVRAEDIGARIRVQETTTNTAGEGAPASSAPTAQVVRPR
jgi:hypothetical protein